MLQSPSCRGPTGQVSSHVIWFVYALPLPLLADAVVRLLPSRARNRLRGTALVVCSAAAAGFIALPASSGWILQARYHLLSDTPVYLRLAADGLSIVMSLALLASVASDGLGHNTHSLPSHGGDGWILSATLCVLLAGNPLTLLCAWSVFGLIRVVASLGNPDDHASLAIAGELGSLAALLAASQPLGLAGLSNTFYPTAPGTLSGWLVAAASMLRMGVHPLQAEGPAKGSMRLSASISGLYLLLRTAPPLPALATAAAALALVTAVMAAGTRDAAESWGWLIQHGLLLGILGASVGPSGKLAGLAAIVCIALCQPAIERLWQDRHHTWDLITLAALGGVMPSLGWATWGALLGIVSYVWPKWMLLLMGGGYTLCAWAFGRNARAAWSQEGALWRELLCWRNAWRALPALALLVLGLWPGPLTYHGAAPPWRAIGSSSELIGRTIGWPIALGLAVLTSASLALGWIKAAENTTQRMGTCSSGLMRATRSVLDGLKHARGALAQIDLTLREHAALAWTTLAAAALILWLRGR